MDTITKSKTQNKLKEIISQPYVLWLFNDDVNSFNWVIECLIKVCKHSPDQASQCAQMVHFNGKCDVKRGDKETIEKMYQKLKGAFLTVTIEES